MLSSLVSFTSILGLATAMTWGTAERARVMVRHEGGRTKVEILGRTSSGEIVEVKAIPQTFFTGNGIKPRRVLVTDVPDGVESICAQTVPDQSKNSTGKAPAFILRSCAKLPPLRTDGGKQPSKVQGLGGRLRNAFSGEAEEVKLTIPGS